MDRKDPTSSVLHWGPPAPASRRRAGGWPWRGVRLVALAGALVVLAMHPSSILAAWVGSHDVTFIAYDFPAAGQSTWYYTVTSDTAPAIGHVAFELDLACLQVLAAGTWGPLPADLVSGGGHPVLSQDPNTALTGLKFEQSFAGGETRNYYFTVNNVNPMQTISVGIQAGQTVSYGTIDGPSCTGTSGGVAAVRPILECVVENSPTSFTAFFGYQNDNSVPVEIQVSPRNFFTPGSSDRGQPQEFEPGRTAYFPNAEFSVSFNGSNLSWTLIDLAGSTRTVTASSASQRCQVSGCGNDVVEPGEQCDDGNAADGDCCSSSCQFEPSTTVCRPAGGVCDVPETCTGSSASCPTDAFAPSTTVCRTAAGVCDVAEMCTGWDASCPADAKSTAVCRPSAGPCDVAESCDGENNDCPADAFAPSTTVCRAAAGVCDAAETCTGPGVSCPADQFQPDGTLCDDHLFCTVADQCVSGVCTGGPRDCSDTVPCTTDTCDEGSGQCVHTLQANCCGNGMVEAGEACDDGNTFSGDGCEPDCTISTTCSYTHGGTPHEVFVNDGAADAAPPACATAGTGDIQAAIDVAADGDIISLCPGTYHEAVRLTKEVTLRSTSGAAVTTVDGRGLGAAVTVERSGTRIEGLTLASDAVAIDAKLLCPLGNGACSTPGEWGSNVTITDNVIAGALVGVDWRGKIDCAGVTNNSFADNDQHLRLRQEERVATPAVLVEVANNTFDRGGSTGVGVEVEGMHAQLTANRVSDAAGIGIRIGAAVIRVAAGTVERAGGAGIVVEAGPAGMQVLENAVRNNQGDGITIAAGAEATRVTDNNITGNGVGVRNEGSGTVDATENWWGSQTGPTAADNPMGIGDAIVNTGGGETSFVEFLCRPFPDGFPSQGGVCGMETPELRQLTSGGKVDVDLLGRVLAFETTEDLNNDPQVTANNADGSREIMLVNLRRPRSVVGSCFGGNQPGAACRSGWDCPGSPHSDPVVSPGRCVMFSQLTNNPEAPGPSAGEVRLIRQGKRVAFDVAAATGEPRQVLLWDREAYLRGQSADAMTQETSGGPGQDSQHAAFDTSGRRLVMESAADPVGFNADGNTEIFLLDTKEGTWTQITDTRAPVENRRPDITGSRITFDSTGDLDDDPRTNIDNQDGNREIFQARKKRGGFVITQLTDTQAPVDNQHGVSRKGGVTVIFSSNGDLNNDPKTNINNQDGNREIFQAEKNRRGFVITQLTDSVGGENVMPAISKLGRYVVFESTADLLGNGAQNRRVFQLDLRKGNLRSLSRSRFGDNFHPRTGGWQVVWESTADLTGHNPTGDRVIYVFDRRKSERKR